MKDSDQAIEKVLAGLRDAEAPAGMERRILEAVQNHASAPSRWNRLTTTPRLLAGRPMVCAVALTAVVALVLAIPAIHQRRHAPTQSAGAILPAPQPSAPSATVAESAQPQRRARIARTLRRPKPKRLELVDTQESLAMRETNAASRLAPPLPLTEQEKFLMHYVRTRTPEQLAANDPANRSGSAGPGHSADDAAGNVVPDRRQAAGAGFARNPRQHKAYGHCSSHGTNQVGSIYLDQTPYTRIVRWRSVILSEASRSFIARGAVEGPVLCSYRHRLFL